MTLEEAKRVYLDVREKTNALGLCFYLSSLDQETEGAPRASLDYRTRQLSAIDGMMYDMTTSAAYGEAVAVIAGEEKEDGDLAHEAEVAHARMQDLSRVPKEEYLAYSELLQRAYPAYVEAKISSDFPAFLPYLEGIFRYNVKYADWVAKEGLRGYDVHLDTYEKGYTEKDYDRFFSLLREKLVPLIARLSEKASPLPEFAKRHYPREGQIAFCKYLGEVMHFDPERTAMLESEHPFTTNNGNHDVRITNHYYEDNFVSSIFSAIHEMGHGLYELGVADKFEGTGNSGGASLALHESQSRLWENMIGRSLAFWETHFPKLKEIFPEQLEGVTAEEFYRYVNRVECSLIRTEADEVTYSIHVMIRYELEKAVMRGELEAKDIPAAWNAKYTEYLGVTPSCDKEGCLQDMHWAGGSLGYFPTYALGSAYAAQIMAAMEKDLDVDAAIRENRLSDVVAWLGDHLHTYGASRYPKELLRIATGEDFDPTYYVDYLTKKYTEIYGL